MQKLNGINPNYKFILEDLNAKSKKNLENDNTKDIEDHSANIEDQIEELDTEKSEALNKKGKNDDKMQQDSTK